MSAVPGAARVVRTVAIGFSAVAVIAFVSVAVIRAAYPYEMEWIEGGMRETVRRVIAGRPIYAAPALEYVSFMYPPLYYHVASWMARVTGEGFLALRLVSLLSMLAAFALAARLATRGVTGRWPGVLAAGLFAATFAASGGWMDLGRVDALFIAIALGGAAVLAGAGARDPAAPAASRMQLRAGVVAGVCFALAWFTKQAGVLIAVPLLAWCWFRAPRAAVACAVTLGLLAGAGTWALSSSSAGWFWYYIAEVPRGHHFDPAAFDYLIRHDLPPRVPMLLFGIAGVAAARAAARVDGFDLALFVGFAGVALYGRLHEGGAENWLMLLDTALAIIAARGVHALTELAMDAGSRGALFAGGTAALLVVQFLVLAYPPSRYLPTAADRAAGDDLVRRLRAMSGDVWVPSHGYLAALAGKQSHAHLAGVIDVLRAVPETRRTIELQPEIERAFAARRFSAIVLDDQNALEPHLAGLYRSLPEPLFEPGDPRFLPRTGAPDRPVRVWVPQP